MKAFLVSLLAFVLAVSAQASDCTLTCCKGNYCTPKVVGSYVSGSASACNDQAAAASNYPDYCPSPNGAGFFGSSYSSTSSTMRPSVVAALAGAAALAVL